MLKANKGSRGIPFSNIISLGILSVLYVFDVIWLYSVYQKSDRIRFSMKRAVHRSYRVNIQQMVTCHCKLRRYRVFTAHVSEFLSYRTMVDSGAVLLNEVIHKLTLGLQTYGAT